MKYRSKILLLSLCMLFQAACSNKAVYTEESFAYDSLFKLRVEGEVAMACESARRALLGQGYLIESANGDGVKGRKAYKSEDKENTFIEMNIVCLPEPTGSTVFATGVLSTYALKMSSSSASVGLSALGSISLPIGQSADSLVKVSEETIDDKEFYRRFFAAVDNILGEMKAGNAALEPAAEPAAPEPTPAQVAPAMAVEPAPTPPLEPAITPESVPAPEAPAITPESVPAPEAPAITPESVPAPEAPAITPESVPAPEAPAITPESVPAPEAPAITPESVPAPDAPAVVPEPTPEQEAPTTASEQLPAP